MIITDERVLQKMSSKIHMLITLCNIVFNVKNYVIIIIFRMYPYLVSLSSFIIDFPSLCRETRSQVFEVSSIIIICLHVTTTGVIRDWLDNCLDSMTNMLIMVSIVKIIQFVHVCARACVLCDGVYKYCFRKSYSITNTVKLV